MSNENLANQIIDETLESLEVQHQGFVVDNDEKAEWALRKIAEEKADMQRYINTCESMILEYKRKIQKAQEEWGRSISFFEGKLRGYFETLKCKETKTQKTYKLPSGTLKMKFPAPKFNIDEEQLVKWLKISNHSDYIEEKTVEKPKWAEFKKCVKTSGCNAITEDGEVIVGVTVEDRTPEFIVEI